MLLGMGLQYCFHRHLLCIFVYLLHAHIVNILINFYPKDLSHPNKSPYIICNCTLFVRVEIRVFPSQHYIC